MGSAFENALRVQKVDYGRGGCKSSCESKAACNIFKQQFKYRPIRAYGFFVRIEDLVKGYTNHP